MLLLLYRVGFILLVFIFYFMGGFCFPSLGLFGGLCGDLIWYVLLLFSFFRGVILFICYSFVFLFLGYGFFVVLVIFIRFCVPFIQ